MNLSLEVPNFFPHLTPDTAKAVTEALLLLHFQGRFANGPAMPPKMPHAGLHGVNTPSRRAGAPRAYCSALQPLGASPSKAKGGPR